MTRRNPGPSYWWAARSRLLGRGPYGDGYGWWDKLVLRWSEWRFPSPPDL